MMSANDEDNSNNQQIQYKQNVLIVKLMGNLVDMEQVTPI